LEELTVSHSILPTIILFGLVAPQEVYGEQRMAVQAELYLLTDVTQRWDLSPNLKVEAFSDV